MSTATLTSLAMLKVNLDQGGDYLEYLRPFVLQILVDHEPDPVTDRVVRNLLCREFGLEIPERTVQIVLKRLSRRFSLKKDTGVYRITGPLPNPNIAAKKTEAERHIQAVLAGLIEFSKNTCKVISTNEEAVTAICAFLAEFNIACLRAYLRGTTIPTITGRNDTGIVLVSEYVLHLQQTDPERFESFLIVLQGHMLANALLCPDLQNAPKSYKGVTFYLDTPLLIRYLGLEGQHKEAAIKELIRLLRNLGGAVATFSHTRDELERVVRGAANHVDAWDGRGAIIMEARRSGKTKSDLLLLAGEIDDKLEEADIEVIPTPPYTARFQIDEKVFERVLDDEVSYFNPRAKEYDINSLRSIYVIRRGTAPQTLEKSRAVLVTSNSGFARAAFQYGQEYEESREVSAVITDFSLANMAWLKAPMGAPSLPITEVLAFSYAALQPTKELLDKYLREIDKLQKQGTISERDHQLLRSTTLAQDELMRLTLGDEEALTQETVTETLRRVSSEIKKEESERLAAEQEAHRKTQEQLAAERDKKRRLQERLYWRCHRNARFCAWFLSVILALGLLVGIAAGLGLRSSSPILGWGLTGGSVVLILCTLANLIFGTTLKKAHQWLQDRCQTWLIKRESAAADLDLGDLERPTWTKPNLKPPPWTTSTSWATSTYAVLTLPRR